MIPTLVNAMPGSGLVFLAGPEMREKYPKAFPTVPASTIDKDHPQESPARAQPLPVVALVEEPGDAEKHRRPDISAIALTADGKLWKVYQSAGRFDLR